MAVAAHKADVGITAQTSINLRGVYGLVSYFLGISYWLVGPTLYNYVPT